MQDPGDSLGPTLEDVDFEIFPAATGFVSINSVTISGADDFQHVTLSFRKQIDCIDSTQASLIEVKSFNIANLIDSPEVFTLPADKYVVVASTYNWPPKMLDVEIGDGEQIVLNVSFP